MTSDYCNPYDEEYYDLEVQLWAVVDFISTELKKYNINMSMKTKYGTIRYEFIGCSIGNAGWPIFNYFYNGYMWYRWPKWMMSIDLWLGKIMGKIGLNGWLYRRKMRKFKKVIEAAVAKWPQLEDAIVADAQHEWEDVI